MRTSLRFVLLLLCCMFAHNHAANVNAQYLNPKVKDKQVTIRSAALLPAKVDITKESAKGAELMVAESADISVKVMEAVKDALQEKQISIAPNSFETAAMDETRKYTLADIQTRYDALLPNLVNKSKDIKKERLTIGEDEML